MMITIDNSGRIVLPKALRQRFGLAADAELEVIERPDGVFLRPVEQQAAMTKQDGLWVHGGAAGSGIHWDRLIDDARDERLQSLADG